MNRSRQGRPLQLHGVLLTLPEGEALGGRWERELRGRLGGRALQGAIPHDAEAIRAVEQELILAQSAPEAPAAAAYHRLAAALHLADDEMPLKAAPGAAALVAASAAALQLVSAPAPAPAIMAPRVAHESKAPNDLDLPHAPAMPSFANLRVSPPSLTLPAFNPPPAALARLQPVPTGPEDEPPAPRPVAASSGSPVPWYVAVGLAVAAGVSLRFVQLPDYMLPVAVGVAVAAAVVLALRVLAAAPEAPKSLALAAALPPARKVRKVERTDGRKDASARLAALTRTRPSGSGSSRRPRPM